MHQAAEHPSPFRLNVSWRVLVCTPILAWTGVTLGLNYFIFPRFLTDPTAFQIAQALSWLVLALLAYALQRTVPELKQAPDRRAVPLAAGLGLGQVSLAVLAGLVFGFGYSPYGHSPAALLVNFVYLAGLLLGVEMARSVLIRSFPQNKQALGVLLAAVLMTLAQQPVLRLFSLQGGPAWVRFLGEETLPGLSANLLASFLALFGGPLPAVIYRGILMAFEWGSPILPDPGWMVAALLGTLAPALGLVYVQNVFQTGEAEEVQVDTKEGGLSPAWILVLVAGVALIWFNLGFFGVRPFLVSGYSMKPTFVAGDIVVVQKVETQEIQEGDVIQFMRESMPVVHRVIQIQEGEQGLVFTTRGDGNNVEDPPVPEQLVTGKVVRVIPKVGWLAVGLRRAFAWAF